MATQSIPIVDLTALLTDLRDLAGKATERAGTCRRLAASFEAEARYLTDVADMLDGATL